MDVLRALLFSFLAVFGILAAGFAWLVVSHVPAGLRLAAIMATTEGCTAPDEFPLNAGHMVVSAVRWSEDDASLTGGPIEAWVDEQVTRIGTETDPSRDLVVYVHGFNTSLDDAICAGEVLRADLSSLPAYATGDGPDVLVFGWPGEFRAWEFAPAQANAARSGQYLGDILSRISDRRIFIVAHSLGAGVTMTAADGLPRGTEAPPLAGILLVQGAIPALSVREWSSKVTITYPAAELDDMRRGRPRREPFVETSMGSGSFVNAAARASHLVVTTAGLDIPLGRAMALKESFFPADRNRPMVPPEIGDAAGNAINVQAIGTPFPTGRIYRTHEDVLPDFGADHPLATDHHEPDIPTLKRADPSRVTSRTEWLFEFRVPHPSYHEMNIGRGQWWRLLRDWHGVMNNPGMRRDILRESWAVFDQAAN